jgi:hypothetical protein
MRARPKHARKTTFGLGALVLSLAVSLGLSSVAWSSTPAPAKPAQSKGPSRQQVQQFLKQDARKARAAICGGPHRSQFPCGGDKSSRSGKVTAGQRKLLRSYLNVSDPKCPFWNVNRPRAGFATVFTDATAICVEGVSGRDISGVPFRFSQAPEFAILGLWAYTNHRWIHWNTSDYLGNCSVVPIDLWIFLYHANYATLCSVHLGVAAPIFPPAGTYRGKLIVQTFNPFWSSRTMLQATSEDLCYFCR